MNTNEKNAKPSEMSTTSTPEMPTKKKRKFSIIRTIGIVAVVLLIAGGVFNTIKQAAIKKSQEATNNTLPATTVRPEVPGVITIGAEYAFPGQETAFKDSGISGIKFYPENYTSWGKMQSAANKPIDFTQTDDMVKRYQNNGMTNITMGLRYDASWAKQSNGIPKPEYMVAYENWLTKTVERYDGDGKDDMPGLRAAINTYEIGVEFSSYAPASGTDYEPFLARSYTIAHNAYPDVKIAHAAFLTMNVFKDDPASTDYAKAFNSTRLAGSGMKSYADITAILDHPEAFDVLNLHALTDPTEIDRMVRWANYEMQRRNYSKPIIISDTSTNPFIAFGPATTCTGAIKGVIIYPAVEADRCNLAKYFTNLVNNDATAIAFVRQFSAEDVSKKIIVAAANNVTRIDAAFTEDIAILKKAASAGAGNAAWGGLLDNNANFLTNVRTVNAKLPGFYALGQTQSKLKQYDSIKRVTTSDNKVRIYEVKNGSATSWIAWYEPGKVYLPGDVIPSVTIALPNVTGTVNLEYLITKIGATTPDKQTGDAAKLTLTPTPVFITK
jgi:hypothetical protein